MSTFGLIALLIVLFILYIGYSIVRDCKTGKGGLFSKICHILT